MPVTDRFTPEIRVALELLGVTWERGELADLERQLAKEHENTARWPVLWLACRPQYRRIAEGADRQQAASANSVAPPEWSCEPWWEDG